MVSMSDLPIPHFLSKIFRLIYMTMRLDDINVAYLFALLIYIDLIEKHCKNSEKKFSLLVSPRNYRYFIVSRLNTSESVYPGLHKFLVSTMVLIFSSSDFFNLLLEKAINLIVGGQQ